MVERSDITYFWPDSPRIAQVDGPSAEFVVQDIVDTFRAVSADIGGAGLDAIDDEALLTEASGKDDLGGGVEVGITATGNQVQLAFEARTTPISVSTVSTGDVLGKTLIAIGATFQTDLVGRGDIVINFTDESMASVLRVLTEETLEVDGLTGGTDNQFDISDSCKVYDVEQCEISGGNWVSVDNIGDPILSILPTFGTQIVRTSASSATTQQQADIEQSSFNNMVKIDINNKTGNAASGIIFPAGTGRQPCDNIPDALTIAVNRGLLKLFIFGDITFTTGHDITDFIVEGESAIKSLITVDAGAVVDDAEFEECTIQGTLDSNASVRNSIILNLSFFEGFFIDCALDGTIVLGGTNETHLVNCHDATAGAGPSITTIDMGGSGRGLVVRNFEGGLEIINKTGPEAVSIGISLGRLVLDSTVTNGEIVVRIVGGEITDNSVGATVVSGSVLNPTTINENVLKLIESQRGHHTATGNIFYWDPINGLDANDGLTSIKAKLTWGGVNALVVANNHDLILIDPGEAAGRTIITEQIDIDKEYTFVRGPGRDVKFSPTATTGPTVTVSAEGVELSGCSVDTAVTGDGEALEVNGDFCSIHDIWIEHSQADGIRLLNVVHAILKDIHIRDCVGDAVLFRGTAQDCMYNTLSDAFILNNTGNGVLFEGANCQHNYVWGGEDGITIMGNGGWGVLEQTSANFNHVVGPTIHIDDNTVGDVSFIGAGSKAENIEQWAKNNDMLRMLGLANENTNWSDFLYDDSVSPPRILTAKINMYTESTLTTRLTDEIGNIVYLLDQTYNPDGSTKTLSFIRTT